jgi:hypothetical protein
MAIFYIGSFQVGDRVDTENPLETVWSYIERIAASDFLATRGGLTSEHALFAAVRVRQAVEFRNASSATTLVTRPLPLYYSALNLARAGIAVVSGRQPTPAHGLKHIRASELLSNAAKVVPGTFTDFLSAWKSPHLGKGQLSLEDCFAALPELADQYSLIPGRASRAIPVEVRYASRLHLEFDSAYLPADVAFDSQWRVLFPKLGDVCELGGSSSYHLIVKDSVDVGSYEAIGRFCSNHLENRLSFGTTPLWYAIHQLPDQTLLPRPAYYFAGLFILSSIVRYQPELLAAADVVHSQVAWLLGRFLAAAERFYPQLLYSWIVGTDTYFGGVA